MKNIKRYFGLHFDFHADNDTEIGLRTNEKDIQWYINETHPDFIQCDCKGHPGNSCYPTKVGKPADKLRADNLKIWVQTSKKNGIPIYVHYSGILDEEYTKAHPEDAAVDENGNRKRTISLFGSYLDNLLIPQTKELIENYGIDGIWIDGDCWAVERDYSEMAKPYLWEGITKEEHDKVMHDAFLRYLKKYVDTIHEFAPDFKITSNWAYSSYIPEKPEVDIDFISGDYSAVDSVRDARYEGRCIAAQNMPWDLMTWSFGFKSMQSLFAEKPAVQMKQEAAVILALGGGFQMYIMQNKDGSAKVTTSMRFREVSEFVRARREINFEKKPIAQVGVFYSADSRYKKSNIFNAAGATDALKGVLHGVLDAQYTANIILEYQIDELEEYDIVVIPEWEHMSKIVKDALVNYAKCGGNLVVVGADVCTQIAEIAGENIGKTATGETRSILDENGTFAVVRGDILDLKSGSEYLYNFNDVRDKAEPSYKISDIEKGKIAYVPFGFGTCYFETDSYLLCNYLKRVFAKLNRPIIEINKPEIDIILQENGSGTIINIINMNEGRHNLKRIIYNEVPSVYDIEILLDRQYEKISMPFDEDFKVEVKNGRTLVKLPRLNIHSVILAE